nr:helix-turn-helix transcriptional regulator [Caballeronia sp. INDeC2]
MSTLREARKTAGLSQVELARRLDLTQSIIGKCERGERRLDVIELREWCGAIGIPLYELILQLESSISQFEAVKNSVRKPASGSVEKAGKQGRKT